MLSDNPESLGFDPSKFYLGVLCKRGHRWQGTDQSLRKSSGRNCVECMREEQIARRQARKEALAKLAGDNHSLGFDPTRMYLGILCKQGHRHKDTDQTLRDLQGECIECKRQQNKIYRQSYKPKIDESSRVGDLYYLGTLCVRQHRHQDEEKSLRYVKSQGCVECTRQQSNTSEKRAYNSRYRQENREEYKAYRRQYYRRNKETYSEAQKIYRQKYADQVRLRKKAYYEANKPQILEAQAEYRSRHRDRYAEIGRRYYRQNREALRAKNARWREKNREQQSAQKARYYQENKNRLQAWRREFAKQNPERVKQWQENVRKNPNWKLNHTKAYQKRRALKASAHHASYSSVDLLNRRNEFEGRCAYCDRAAEGNRAMTVDHFISLNKGGSDTIGNLIPACKRCNSSKGSKDPHEWYQQQEFYSKSRWRKILKALGKTQQNYHQIPLL